MDEKSLLSHLTPPDARHFLSLSSLEKASLLEPLHDFDFSLFEEKKPPSLPPLEPLSAIQDRRSFYIEKGREILKGGHVGALIAAGGAGTRLSWNGPKGTFPLPFLHKTLFEILLEKAAREAPHLPIAFMTSLQNHDETVSYFKKNSLFSKKEEIHFFTQDSLPLLDEEGHLFFESPLKLAMGPDGNGKIFSHFVKSGLYEIWKKQGIDTLLYLPVDNPLADPFDLELIGALNENEADIVIKAILRRNPEEKVGVLAQSGSKIFVVEYSELDDRLKRGKTKDGLLFPYANIGLYSLSMDFALKAASARLPLHRAHKASPFFKNGSLIPSTRPNAWKFETFIFDLIPLASKAVTLVSPRETCFAPLKEKGDVEALKVFIEK